MDVSVLIPLKDTAYLNEAVQSVIDADWAGIEYEVILLTENTNVHKIVKEKCGNTARFRIIETFGHNLPATLNLGLQAAHGEFIARFDGDDINYRSRFQLQAEFLKSHPACVAIGGQVLQIDQSGTKVGKSIYPTTWRRFKQMIPLTCCIAHPATMYRKEVAQMIGGYNECLQTSEDWDFWLRLQKFGEIYSLPNTLIKYRIHPSQRTQANAENNFVYEQNFLEDYWDDLVFDLESISSDGKNPVLNCSTPVRIQKWQICRRRMFTLELLRIKRNLKVLDIFSKSWSGYLSFASLIRQHPLLTTQAVLVYILNKSTLIIRGI